MTNADKLREAFVAGNCAGGTGKYLYEVMATIYQEETWRDLTKCKADGCDNRAAFSCDGYCKQCREEIDCLDEGR